MTTFKVLIIGQGAPRPHQMETFQQMAAARGIDVELIRSDDIRNYSGSSSGDVTAVWMDELSSFRTPDPCEPDRPKPKKPYSHFVGRSPWGRRKKR